MEYKCFEGSLLAGRLAQIVMVELRTSIRLLHTHTRGAHQQAAHPNVASTQLTFGHLYYTAKLHLSKLYRTMTREPGTCNQQAAEHTSQKHDLAEPTNAQRRASQIHCGCCGARFISEVTRKKFPRQ